MHPYTNLRITITIYVVVIEGLDILPHFHLKTTNKDIWWPNILTSESEFDFVITIGAISVAGTALTKATTKVSKEKTGKKKKVKETQTSTTDVSTTLKKKKINELVCSHSLPAELQTVCREFHKRLAGLESEKYDLEWKNKMKNLEINELNILVNDLRGKFIKPTLRKVSKYENKFAKLQKKAAEFNFRNQLKQVKKKEFTMEEEDKEKKPDWSKKGGEGEKKVKDGDGEDSGAEA